MIVTGYNENKLIERLDLLVNDILDKEIDPFHLDLFDPNPIVVEGKLRPVYFNKIRDLAFAYVDGSWLHIGIHDGNSAVALQSRSFEVGKTLIEARQLEPSRYSFRHLLSRYLTAGRTSPWCDRYLVRPNGVRIAGNTIALTRKLFWDDYGQEIKVEIDQYPTFFRGEMMRETGVALELSPQIKWVFETLGQFKPAVVYQTAWNALHGRATSDIEVVVPYEVHEAAAAVFDNVKDMRLTQTSSGDPPKNWRHYKRLGCRFHLTNLGYGQKTVTEYLERSEKKRFSVHYVYCPNPGEVRGARIAMLDIARMYALPMSHLAQQWAQEQLRHAPVQNVWFQEYGSRVTTPKKGLDPNQVFKLLDSALQTRSIQPYHQLIAQPTQEREWLDAYELKHTNPVRSFDCGAVYA